MANGSGVTPWDVSGAVDYDKLIKELNLTGEQKAKLEELKKEIAKDAADRGGKEGKKGKKNKDKGEATAK